MRGHKIFPAVLGIGGLIGVFLLLTVPHLQIRLGDTSVYIATASLLLEGKRLYSDVVFTNTPLFPYILGLYLKLTYPNLLLVYGTVLAEIALCGILVFAVLQKLYKSVIVSLLGMGSFLFSYTVLASSISQQGVFIAVLLILIAFLIYNTKYSLYAAIPLAVACMVKAYFFPVVVGFIIHRAIQEKRVPYIFSGLFIGTVVILGLPFIGSMSDMASQLFGYSLGRPAVTNKISLFGYVIPREWLLIVLSFASFMYSRRLTLNRVILACIAGAFLLWKDMYIVYFLILIPHLVIESGAFFSRVKETTMKELAIIASIVGVFFSSLLSIGLYQQFDADVARIKNYPQLLQVIKEQNPSHIYGIAELAPLLSYSSNVPLLNGIVDTNINFFRTGIYNAKHISQQILSSRTMIVMYGASAHDDEKKTLVDNVIYDYQTIRSACTFVYEEPIRFDGVIDRVRLYKCYE